MKLDTNKINAERFCRAFTTYMHYLAMCSVSVRPSVCPSHARIESNLMIVGSCGYHRRVVSDYI